MGGTRARAAVARTVAVSRAYMPQTAFAGWLLLWLVSVWSMSTSAAAVFESSGTSTQGRAMAEPIDLRMWRVSATCLCGPSVQLLARASWKNAKRGVSQRKEIEKRREEKEEGKKPSDPNATAPDKQMQVQLSAGTAVRLRKGGCEGGRQWVVCRLCSLVVLCEKNSSPGHIMPVRRQVTLPPGAATSHASPSPTA